MIGKIVLLFVFFQILFLPCFGQVVINEVMYNPDQCSDSCCEWIELFNPTNEEINLSGWSIYDPSKHEFKILTTPIIEPKNYFILAKKPENFSQYYTVNCPIAEVSFSLNNNGETINLTDNQGNLIDSVTYDLEWGGNGDGKTLERINPFRNSNNSSNWNGSLVEGGTPGKLNSVANFSFVLLQEKIFANTTYNFTILIALQKNLTNANVSLKLENVVNWTLATITAGEENLVNLSLQTPAFNVSDYELILNLTIFNKSEKVLNSLQNITISPRRDLSIESLSFNTTAFVNETLDFSSTVKNKGLENETNISVGFFVNGGITNDTKINLCAGSPQTIHFNYLFNSSGNYTICVNITNSTIPENRTIKENDFKCGNISITERPPEKLILTVNLKNYLILNVTYESLFKLDFNNTKPDCNAADYPKNLDNVTVLYNISNSTGNLIKEGNFTVKVGCSKSSGTGNWTPNQTGNFEICGRIINATTSFNNTTVCKNVSVIDPKTILCNLTINIYAPIIWYNDNGSNYHIFVNDSFGNYSNYPVKINYWIEDYFSGNYISRHSPHTTTQNTKNNKSMSYTPKLNCGTEAYWIKANITNSYCNNTNSANSIAQKLIVVIGDKKCADCPDCPKCSSKKEESKKKSKTLEIEILNLTKTLARNQEFTTAIKLKNKANEKIQFEIYSYVYKGSKSITGGWTSNKEELSLKKGEEKIINLTNKIKEDAEPGEYTFRVRAKIGYNEIDLTDKIRVTNETIEDKIKEGKTKTTKEIPKLKIWNDTKLRINLSNCSDCKMIIVGPNISVITDRKYRVFEDSGKYEVFVIRDGIVLNQSYIWDKEQNFTEEQKPAEENKMTGKFLETRPESLVDKLVSTLQNLVSPLIKLMENSIQQ